MINSLLVANRGEIARRIFATCRALGIATVAVYSDAESAGPHVRDADAAVHLAGSAAGETYLRADRIIEAAIRAGADAIHPGYGFLAENAEFAAAVIDAGLCWVGPPPKAIAAMGSKLEAKALLAEVGVPMLPTWTEPDQVTEFPVLVKASAGGGGRGMRIVRDAGGLARALATARREAAAAFGDGTVFCERYLDTGRHIEVQLLADALGGVVALGERECSIQRRHQKIIEECPSPAVDDPLRAALARAAVAAARAVGYVGAGTVEFLLAPDGRFYFLEMNTRLQVEHPVTECVFGLDLVRLQLLIAEGRPLPFTQPPPMRGHAIEARLYAEDPARDWRPSVGPLHRFAIDADVRFAPLAAAGIRVDSGVEGGSVVTVHYDALLAKVIAWAEHRDEAARRLATCLARASLHGVITNRDLLVHILRSPEYLSGGTDTAFLSRHPEVFTTLLAEPAEQHLACLAAALAGAAARQRSAPWGALPAGWRNVASTMQLATFDAPAGRIQIGYRLDRSGQLAAWSALPAAEAVPGLPTVESLSTTGVGPPAGGAAVPDVQVIAASPEEVVLDLGGIRRTFTVHHVDRMWYVDSPRGGLTLMEVSRFAPPELERPVGSLLAPIPGAVGRVAVTVGQRVDTGDLLLTLEAMKLEHPVHAPGSGIVAELRVQSGIQVEAGAVLAVITVE